MVQPSGGLRWPLLAAAEIWCCVQVAPPSRETATWSAAGAALPFSWPWNIAQQIYTLPKNGLDAALSAQICDLSENVVSTAWTPPQASSTSSCCRYCPGWGYPYGRRRWPR